MATVREVLEAKSIVVIGASRDPSKPGASLLQVILNSDFKGQVAGINPQGGEVNGVKLYRSLEEVPFEVDLGVMLIPPKSAPEALWACARKGLKGVVISSEGFAEAGPEGRAIQEEIRKIFKTTGMRGFGPNTLGLVNSQTGLTTSYYVDGSLIKPGSIGFAAQSGIFVGALLRYLGSFEGLRISKGLGLGNKVDVDESDALAYLAEDEQTRLIGMYLEDIRDGRKFLETAKAAVRRKPVLLLKGGRSPQGAKAIASHTASLAVDDVVLDGALRQAGVIRMNELDELIGSLMGFAWMPLPRGDRIGLITYSGAQAIMSVDKAVEEGLRVAEFAPGTREKIARVIANDYKAHNPIDIYPDMMTHGFEKTNTELMKALLEDDGVHGIFFISFALPDVGLYRPLLDLIRENPAKPVFFSLMGHKEHVEFVQDLMLKERIPFYLFPEQAVRVFAHMCRYAKRFANE